MASRARESFVNICGMCRRARRTVVVPQSRRRKVRESDKVGVMKRVHANNGRAAVAEERGRRSERSSREASSTPEGRTTVRPSLVFGCF
jgi:hypothetical protein